MKKNTTIISVFLILFGVFICLFFIKFYYFSLSYVTTDVKRGEVLDQVYAMGKVESVANAYLYFKNPGKVTNINVKVGDTVKTGDVLASQDLKDIASQVTEINAGISVQRARLNQIKAGSSQQEIDIASSEVSNAQTALSNAELSLKNVNQSAVDALKNAQTTTDDIIRNRIDQMIQNPKTATPKLLFTPAADSSIGLDIESRRISIEVILKDLEKRLADVSSESAILEDIIYTKNKIAIVKQFIEKVSLLINNPMNRPAEMSQLAWDQWRNDVAYSRTSINSVYTNLTSAQSSINSAESAIKSSRGTLKTANDQLTLKKTSTRKTDVAVYEAQLAQASAEKAKVDALRQDLLVISPINGLVTEVNNKIGELAGPTKSAVTVLSLDKMQIKLNVVENNITKIAVGQKASVTFDAMPGQSFEGIVSSIDPAETEINGTVYYKTIILLNKNENFIRSGMTANVWVTATSSNNTLYIPVTSITKINDKIFVKILENGKVYTKEITVGIKDNKGNVEVTSGLTEGQKVILEIVKNGSIF